MVDILLPVYNGEHYLRQQLDSIISQSYPQWEIIIRDDGSSDSSSDIIKEYSQAYPDKIKIVSDNLGNRGTTECVNLLLNQVESEYFMFCDQDDIWESNKIEVSMEEMMKMEKEHPNIPILICTDACCVDDHNNLLVSSFFENQKFVDTTGDVHKMLALNIVQGSTTLMNRKVKEVISPLPQGLYHDWWVAVNAVYYGKVFYIHKPLLRYRQHQTNVVGALKVGSKYLISKLLHFRKQWNIYSKMYKTLKFRPSIMKWAYYKLIFSLSRL